MIEAFFFGPNQGIFASYHPPAGGGAKVLTVICPPLFNEYMRTQLALRELAIELARRGQHVLRFDYRGTGDSLEDLDRVAISDWIADITLAVREGRDLSGSSTVRLLGVRAGALLAVHAVRTLTDVARLVLWDPVTDGAAYLETLRWIQETIIERNVPADEARPDKAWREYAGYRLSERMVEEFRSLDASAYSSVSSSKLYVLSTSAQISLPLPGATRDVAQFACNWESELENVLLPAPILERLGTWLTMP